jgi:hypothetical protein
MDLPDYNYVLCSCNSKESLLHLFFDYPFCKFNSRIHLRHLQTCKSKVEVNSTPEFLEKYLWLENRPFGVFNSTTIWMGRWKEAFKDEFALVILRAKLTTNALLSNWHSLP